MLFKKLDRWNKLAWCSICSFVVVIIIDWVYSKNFVITGVDLIETLILLFSAATFTAWINSATNPEIFAKIGKSERYPENKTPITYLLFRLGGFELPLQILIFGLSLYWLFAIVQEFSKIVFLIPLLSTLYSLKYFKYRYKEHKKDWIK